MNEKLQTMLAEFRQAKAVASVGMLGTALVVTNRARNLPLPIDGESLITKGGGQVSKLNGNAINRILKSYGVVSEVGTESGRTSRGTPAFAKEYAEFLNELHREGLLSIEEIELWWVQLFVEYFNTEPFRLKYEHHKTLLAVLRDIFGQATLRQRKNPGKMYAGALLQHLVGSKLELVLPGISIVHNGFEVADSVTARAGDFIIDDSVLHCTTAPSDWLIKKCISNIDSGKRPIILTLGKMIGAAEGMAESYGVESKIEIMDALQFLAANLYELSFFKGARRKIAVEELFRKYNEIVLKHESDASLRVEID